MIKRSILLVSLLGSVTLISPVQAATINEHSTLTDTQAESAINPRTPRFDAVISDLPLMPGLELLPDNDVLFVIPRSGRIADSVAVGIVDVDEVYRFYRRSLPQLGWKIADARTYTREDEILSINARADGKATRVEFSVKPLAPVGSGAH